MTDFSTTGVTGLIGALELSDMWRFDDGALELAGLSAGPSPTAPSLGCVQFTRSPLCPRIDDDALENAAERSAVGPTTGCPPTMANWCRRIDDDALELTGLSAGPSPTAPSLGCSTAPPMCRRIDDNALESAGLSAGPSTAAVLHCSVPTFIGPMCRHIDDIALEATAAQVASGPTQMSCLPTQLCPRIDNGSTH